MSELGPMSARSVFATCVKLRRTMRAGTGAVVVQTSFGPPPVPVVVPPVVVPVPEPVLPTPPEPTPPVPTPVLLPDGFEGSSFQSPIRPSHPDTTRPTTNAQRATRELLRVRP